MFFNPLISISLKGSNRILKIKHKTNQMRNLLFIYTMMTGFTLTSCNEDATSTEEIKTETLVSAAKAQFAKDFAGTNTTNTQWSVNGSNHAVVKFNLMQPVRNNVTVAKEIWYADKSNNAVSKVFDNTTYDKYSISAIPVEIQKAFNATVYADITLWTLNEVEYEYSEGEGGLTFNNVYIYEVENKINPNREAKIIIDSKTFEVIYMKESFDVDDNENDNNTSNTLITQALIDAVNSVFPNAKTVIIEAESASNGNIEVDGLVTIDGITSEFEVRFDASLTLLDKEIEFDATFGKLATAEQEAIAAWFNANPEGNPLKPTAHTLVSVELKEFTHVNISYSKTFSFELESINTEYEYTFATRKDGKIVLLEKEID